MLARCAKRVARGLPISVGAVAHVTAPLRFTGSVAAPSDTNEADVLAQLRPQFDYRAIRAQADQYKASMDARGYTSVDIDSVVSLIDERAGLLAETETLRARRNAVGAAVKVIVSKKNIPAGAALPPAIAEAEAELSAGLAETPMQDLVSEGKDLKILIAAKEALLTNLEKDLVASAFKLPNMIHPAAPAGCEANAATLAHHNKGKNDVRDFLTTHGFVPKDHLDIARAHGLVDLENAAKVTGSRFYYLAREAALLELALINYSMQKLVARGFTPVLPPDLARTAAVEGAGFQSRDERSLAHHIYQIAGSDMSLAATSEILMAGRFMNDVIPEAALPLKFVAFNHCFRTEIGGLGTQTRGLYRVHQFSKVEMFVLSTPDQSDAIHDELVAIEQEIFTELGLNFRVLDMPHEDLGAPAFRKIDMEACMPGRALTLARTEAATAAAAAAPPAKGKKAGAKPAAEAAAAALPDPFTTVASTFEAGVAEHYGEISSASNCTDYQARRLNIRYKPTDAAADADAAAGAASASHGAAAAFAAEAARVSPTSAATRFVHTLNGTACAVPRMIVAILEQRQRADGTVEIPEPLRPFMGGQAQIPFPGAKWA